MSDDANDVPATPPVAAAETPLAPAADAGAPSTLPEGELTRLTDEIVSALKTVYDPEIPADIYELGLIYRIDIADDRAVAIDMTLSVPGVGPVKVEIVWDPPWDPSRMSDEARAVLNMW